MRQHRHIDVDPRPAEQIDRLADIALDRLRREDAGELLGQPLRDLPNVVLGDRVEHPAHLLLLRYRCGSMARSVPQSSIRVNIQVVKTVATLAASCPPLLAGPLAADDAERLAAALKVIADPARLRLLSLIQAQPEHEACVCHLTEPLGL